MEKNADKTAGISLKAQDHTTCSGGEKPARVGLGMHRKKGMKRIDARRSARGAGERSTRRGVDKAGAPCPPATKRS